MTPDERKLLWEKRILDYLSSDLTVDEWCDKNHVSSGSLFTWLRRFRKEDPNRFPPKRKACAAKRGDWIEISSKELAVSTTQSELCSAHTVYPKANLAANSTSIVVAIGKAVVAIPPKANREDIANTLEVVIAL